MDVVVNWSLMTSLGYTSAARKMVAAHEFGYAFGHNSAIIPGSISPTRPNGIPVALMYPYDNGRIQGGVLLPQPDDKAGVNALY